MAGKQQSEWLKEIDDDQNVNGLERLTTTLKNALNKHWFHSQVIQPTTQLFQYNSVTGRYETMFSDTQTITANTANAATSTLTCPAGRSYKVYWATRNNATRAATYTLDAVINGVALALIPDDGQTIAINEARLFFGPSSYLDLGTLGHIVLPYIILQPGDTLTITDTTWVALDGQTTNWIYQERAL